jgi:hypothetical protein
MDEKKGISFPPTIKLLNSMIFLIIGLGAFILISNASYFLYNYLFNINVQYLILILVCISMSLFIFLKAIGMLEWKTTEEQGFSMEGQLARMSRRVSLASRGFPFTQDLLRRRVKKIFTDEGILPKNREITRFLETPIEGKSQSRSRGEKYMKTFSDAITLLEESV